MKYNILWTTIDQEELINLSISSIELIWQKKILNDIINEFAASNSQTVIFKHI